VLVQMHGPRPTALNPEACVSHTTGFTQAPSAAHREAPLGCAIEFVVQADAMALGVHRGQSNEMVV
jgi:hypothetical protein